MASPTLMLNVTWNQPTFKSLIEAVAPISEEIKMTFNAEGVEIRVVDYAHVCFIKAIIYPDSFAKYEVTDQVVIATEVEKLKSILKLAKKNPINMSWGLDESKGGLLHFEVGEVVKDVGLLQADLVKAPNEPNLILPIKVKFDFDGQNAYMNCQGSTDKVSITFNKGATTISNTDDTADTNFSVDYLSRILKGVGDSLTLEMGQSLPLRVSSESEGCSMVWMVAPRIDN